MNSRYVLPNETLESIAQQLKIENPKYLRDFHNENSPLNDRFEGEIIAGRKILLPSQDEIKNINKQIIENGDSLYYHPPKGKLPHQIALLDGKYLITQESYQDEKQVVNFQYYIEIAYMKFDEGLHYLNVKMSDFKKDNRISDSKISTLAKQCVESIYPLQLKCADNGTIQEISLIDSVINVKEKLERLKKYFTDDIAASYIEKMKIAIDNPQKIFSDLKNILPIQFIFGSFYRATYGDWTDSSPYHTFYSWLPHASPIRFEFINKILPKENDHELKIIQNGICCDYRSLEQLNYKEEIYDENIPIDNNSVDCNHVATYIFNRNKLSLDKVQAIFTLFIDDVIEKETFVLEKL